MDKKDFIKMLHDGNFRNEIKRYLDIEDLEFEIDEIKKKIKN